MKEFPLYINGKWKRTKEFLDVINPATSKVVAKVSLGSEMDIDEAIAAAHNTYQKTKLIKSYERSAACERISDLIRERANELVETIIAENGKSRKFSQAEVKRAISTFKIASEEANRIEGEVPPLDITDAAKTKFGFWKRFPMGVVAGITPFNFPLNLVAHKIAPALACGNTIVLKPASKTPLSALKLAEIIHEAGAVLPGSVNIVPCRSELGMRLVKDSRVKVVSFTGSDIIGWRLKEAAPKKKVILELGGNAAVIVHSDADLQGAAQKLASSAFGYSGQVCIKTQRIYVQKKVARKFTKLFLKEVRKLRIGDPRRPDTDLGPMIDEDNVRRTENWVREAVKNGAKALAGGKRIGRTYLPTVLTHVNPDDKVCSQEAFAPIVILERYDSFNDALSLVNNSRFGLQAGVFVNDMNLVMEAYEKIDTGTVLINETPSFRVDNMPYGGIKDSGFGREGIRFAIDDMTEIKLLVLNLRR